MIMHTKKLEYVVTCSVGGRYASCLVNSFSKIDSTILFSRKWGRTVNAKSLIGVLSLQIQAGEPITLIVENTNEEQLNKDYEKIIKIMEEE